MSTAGSMREFMSRFRVEDNSLMSFSLAERRQINDFQEFSAKKPDGVCSVCLKKLYDEEKNYRTIEDISSMNCSKWNITPLMKVNERRVAKYMVCKDHLIMKEDEFPVYVYPGIYKEINQFQNSLLIICFIYR